MCIQTRKQLQRASKAMDIFQKHLFPCKYLQALYLSHVTPGCLISVSQAGEKKRVALAPFQFSNQTPVQHAKGKGMCTGNTNAGCFPPFPFPSMPKLPALRTEGFPAADAVTSGQWCSLAFARAKSLSEPCALQLRLLPRGRNLRF